MQMENEMKTRQNKIQKPKHTKIHGNCVPIIAKTNIIGVHSIPTKIKAKAFKSRKKTKSIPVEIKIKISSDLNAFRKKVQPTHIIYLRSTKQNSLESMH